MKHWQLFFPAAMAFVAVAAIADFVVQRPQPDAAEIVSWQVRAGAANDVVAERLLANAARSGSALAQLALGELLLARGTEAGDREGLEWLAMASAAGEARADLVLGKAYLRGAPALPPDALQAKSRLEAAATHGEAGAAYYLGLMYKDGNGVPRDSRLAARWLDTAAKAGVPSAMFILANMYLAGEGVPADPARAREWIEKAAELEHPEANQMLAMGLRDGSMGFEKDEKKAAFQLLEAAHSLKHRPAEP